ncbi:MAG: preprotein translocase subunit Sec61beta [Candidatus Pacearchaeota archaeon]
MGDEILLPAYGGLTRFREEYESKIQFEPGTVIVFVILTIIFVLLLNLLY